MNVGAVDDNLILGIEGAERFLIRLEVE